MPLPRLVATHVRAHLRQGSSSPVLVDTTGGRFVAKLVGAAQGTGALIAEIVVAELAEQLGLPVPERVLIEFETGTPSDDAGDELADLLAMSQGTNLGFRWLESAHTPRPDEIERIDDAFAARVLWLDGLTLNPDRSRSKDR